MEKTNDFTKMFADKTGDKIFIELEITGDPNKAAKILYESMHNNTDLIDGLKVSQICFKGANPGHVINRMMDDSLCEMKNKLTETIQKLRQDFES